MDIITIFGREMVAAARQGRVQGERAGLAILVFLAVGGSFAGWAYWFDGVLDGGMMIQIAGTALWSAAFSQLGIGFPTMLRAAISIVAERERRTLDHLLVTRLSSAGIVLGKLAAGVVATLSTLAAGLPIVLLIHSLGGIDLSWIGLAYAELLAIVLFLGAGAIWVSVESPDRRSAVLLFVLGMMAWMIGPFFLATSAPRLAFRLPAWLLAANWWLAASSPLLVAFHIVGGMTGWDQLVGEVGWMIAVQLAGAVLFTVAAIARLRPAHRTLGGVDRKEARRARRRLVWRLRPRPPVGDDPILWRERYTSRDNTFVRIATLIIFGGLSIGLAVGTFIYARPAFAEVWRHGYGTASGAGPAETGAVLIRLFGIKASANGPADVARTEFNLFLRYATVPIALVLCFLVAGCSSEALGVERARGTWTGLLATPLTAREIVRSAVLASVWRSRYAFLTILVLWTLGLAAGAIHPLAYVVSLFEVVAATWMMATLGALGAIQAPSDSTAPDRGVAPTLFITSTGLLVMFLPAGLNPALIGAGSLPLMVWTSLVFYRELAGASANLLDPRFAWAGFPSGQMPMVVFAAWLVAIVGPATVGARAWRYALVHFDRLVGRPHRASGSIAVSPAPTTEILRRRDGPGGLGFPLAKNGAPDIR